MLSRWGAAGWSSRSHFDAVVDELDLEESYYVAWRALAA
eukprot:COSAG01_NODE_67389_length_267_cov_0.619048_1_plen_38_part_01